MLGKMASVMMAFLAGFTNAGIADDPAISNSGRGFAAPKGGLLHFDFLVKVGKEDCFLLSSQSFRLA